MKCSSKYKRIDSRKLIWKYRLRKNDRYILQGKNINGTPIFWLAAIQAEVLCEIVLIKIARCDLIFPYNIYHIGQPFCSRIDIIMWRADIDHSNQPLKVFNIASETGAFFGTLCQHLSILTEQLNVPSSSYCLTIWQYWYKFSVSIKYSSRLLISSLDNAWWKKLTYRTSIKSILAVRILSCDISCISFSES